MDYVFSATGDPTSLVPWGPAGNCITLHFGSVWPADDPFVLDRPDLFSSTPTVLCSSGGLERRPEPTPLAAPKRRGRNRG